MVTMIRQSWVFLALVICGVSAIQPGCRTRYELRMKWTVQDNNSRYWLCPQWGQAVQVSCPIGTLFSAPYQTCVPERFWEPFPFYAPPTTVNDFKDECSEIEGGDLCVDVCKVVPCEGGLIVDGKCECPAGLDLINGKCSAPELFCIGGQVINGVCQCEPGTSLVNGVCSGKPQDQCENGVVVNDICVCNEGYQSIDGVCKATNGICEGAPASAYASGTWDCGAPACTEEQYWANVHLPTRNPKTFWQCPGIEWVQEMPCGEGTCFDPVQQVCIHAHDWVNPCRD